MVAAAARHEASARMGRSARHARSTRPQTACGAGRRRLSGFDAAGELRLGEKRAGQLQDLVGLAQLAVLSLQVFDALGICCRDVVTLAGINFLLTHPGVQRLRHTANLLGDRLDGSPLRWVLRPVLLHHAHGLQEKTSGTSSWLHSPVLEPPRNPGRFTLPFDWYGCEGAGQMRTE